MTESLPAGRVRMKRAYEEPDAADGPRVLVDRLWPRGLTKEKARIDRWEKELAPSADLRKWFGHDPARWEEFQHRYRAELSENREKLGELRALARQEGVTLVFAARDVEHNDAVVLRDVLLGR